jgi:hypothetical protein
MHLSSTGVLTGTTVTTATGPSQVTLRTIALALQAVSSEQIAAQQLQLRGYRNATGTLTAGAPLVRSPTFSVTGHYTIPGWQEWLKGAGASIMPLGLRVLGITGDGPMGPIVPQPSIDFSTTPCFSVTQSEDNSLEIPAGYQFAFLPPDAQVTSSCSPCTANFAAKPKSRFAQPRSGGRRRVPWSRSHTATSRRYGSFPQHGDLRWLRNCIARPPLRLSLISAAMRCRVRTLFRLPDSVTWIALRKCSTR